VISVSATLVPCLCADSRLVWFGLVWLARASRFAAVPLRRGGVRRHVGPAARPLRGLACAPCIRLRLRAGSCRFLPHSLRLSLVVPRTSRARRLPAVAHASSAHRVHVRPVHVSCMLRSCARTACLERLTTCDQACGALSVGIPNSPEFTMFGAILVVSWSLPPISACSTTTGCGVKMTPQPSRYGGLSQ
jgi:hypothetical protein